MADKHGQNVLLVYLVMQLIQKTVPINYEYFLILIINNI